MFNRLSKILVGGKLVPYKMFEINKIMVYNVMKYNLFKYSS